MRRQKTIFAIYLVMTAAAAWLSPFFVTRAGIFGAALAYLILMALMAAGFVGLSWFWFKKEVRNG